MTLKEKVFKQVTKIPRGRILTYAALARRARCRSVRAVAACLKSSKNIPCHRIVRSDRRVGAYFGSWQREPEKARRLAREGIIIIKRGRRYFYLSQPSQRRQAKR